MQVRCLPWQLEREKDEGRAGELVGRRSGRCGRGLSGVAHAPFVIRSRSLMAACRLRRGCMALRPAADARWEVLVETADGITLLGPFTDAADIAQALREGTVLGIRELPSAA